MKWGEYALGEGGEGKRDLGKLWIRGINVGGGEDEIR